MGGPGCVQDGRGLLNCIPPHSIVNENTVVVHAQVGYTIERHSRCNIGVGRDPYVGHGSTAHHTAGPHLPVGAVSAQLLDSQVALGDSLVSTAGSVG
jgi:hypothetical protein